MSPYADLPQLLLLLPLALLVAGVAHRLQWRATPLLLAAGGAIGALSWPFPTGLSRELLFGLLLPPLIFEAGMVLPWPLLRRELPVLLAVSTLGVMLATVVVAVAMNALAGWPWSAAMLFAALIAATDPVAVIAFFKESGIGGRLRLLVEAESLFNDGSAAVLFAVLLSISAGGVADPVAIGLQFARTCLIAGGCGALCAWLATALLRRLPSGAAWMAGSLVIAYGAFHLAEHLGASGVLAALVAGLLSGNRMACTEAAIGGSAGARLAAFWQGLAFAANSLVFVLIGVEAMHRLGSLPVRDALWAVLLVLLGRLAAVVPCCLLFGATDLRVPWATQLVMTWGGLRGALALALAMEIPDTLAGRTVILPVSCAVVLFSLVVQAGSLPALVTRLEARSAGR